MTPPSPRRVLPSSILDNSTAQMRSSLVTIKEVILAKTPIDSKVWFIQLGSIGMEAMILRYEIAPRTMNGTHWSVGNKYFEGDVWTEDILSNHLLNVCKIMII
ncbi:MAG: hypothetical protein HOP07_01035 [Bacteriovoracaceae bacterium]|nr:hypothetical protein [Bacteriovoracaceae bacterium]